MFQIFADFVSLMTSNILGLFAFYQVDKQQRTAFLETRQSLKMKLSIEEQSAEQVKKKFLQQFFSSYFLHSIKTLKYSTTKFLVEQKWMETLVLYSCPNGCKVNYHSFDSVFLIQFGKKFNV